MSVLREAESARTEHLKNHGTVRDYGLQHEIEVFWDLNADAEKDRIFKLKVDDYEVLIDVEELLRKLRWV